MRWIKYNDKIPEQHAAELHWRHSSDKSPLHMKQHVVIGNLKVEYEAGRYEYDLNNLEYLDESAPLADEDSIRAEALRLYPKPKSSDDYSYDLRMEAKASGQRSAHITCARMYLSRLAEKDGEIEGLKAEVAELKTKLYGIKHNL